MKKTLFLLFITGGFLAANFAVPVFGAGNSSRPGLEKIEKSAKPKQVCLAKNRMYGDVKEIDHAKGLVSFTNNHVDLKLHFPPEDIKDLKTGDNITVEMGYYKGALQE